MTTALGPAPESPGRDRVAAPSIAYVMSRFPKISETFILSEMIAVENSGLSVELYPLIRERGPTVHPQAIPWVERAHFVPLVSWRVLLSHLWFIRHRPRAYLGTLAGALRSARPSRRFLVRTAALIPRVVHIARTMESEGVTHVHCHFATHPATAGLIIKGLVGIPFSFTAHGSDLHVDRTMLPLKVAEAEFVVAVSQDNRDLIIHDCGPGIADKVRVVHCGVDTDLFSPPDPEPSNGDGHTLEVLCVGTLHEVKGQGVLLEALARLNGEGIAFHCTFIGDGPDLGALRNRARELGISASVEFIGRAVSGEVARRVRECDVLVAPSVPTTSGRREGIPVVLMEAMAAGRPVVTSRLSGIPELVEDEVNGILTEPGDVKAVARALVRLHRQPDLRRELGDRGRQTVLSGFDSRRNARILHDLLTAGAGA